MKINKKLYGKTLIDSNNVPYKNKKIVYSENYKKVFFNNITHELKTPITIILGYSQLLKEEMLSTEDLYLRAIDNIECESKRLNSLIDELLEKTKEYIN